MGLLVIFYVLILSAYTLFQSGRHFRIIIIFLLATLSNPTLKRIFNLEQSQKGQFAIKQKNTKMAAILD